MAKNFTWVQTHQELTQYLAEKENSQEELVELLRESGVTAGLVDEDPEGNRFDLEEIDPFSFFCFIYKYGPEKRLQILQSIAEKLDLHYPEDELGIPSAQAQKVMMFPFRHHRNENEIEHLWQCFYSALDGSITDDQFEKILNQYGVGPVKITEALFYIAPERYMPINGPVKPWLKQKLGIDPSFSTYTEYLELLDTIKEATGKPFYELSYDGWLWTEKQKKKDAFREKFEPLIERYKRYLEEYGLEKEQYKWEAIHHFQQTFDIDADDFTENFKEAVSKASNLVYQNSIGFIRKAAQYFPEDVRQMFRTLYDEEIPLEDRFRQFTESAEELLPKVIEERGKKLNHQQDERTLSYYLTMRFPEKYPLYKDETYKYLLFIMGDLDAKPAGEKYFHYLELTEKLIFAIESESELVKMVESLLTEECYQGEQKWIILQDILWVNMRFISQANYWVFQCNPSKFDVISELKEGNLSDWSVDAHKDKIKEGDKVILWVTGKQAGCYALCETTSDVYEDIVEVSHKGDGEQLTNRVDMKITHNLVENPVMKAEVEQNERLSDLNVGHQGTNFTATQEEYETLIEMAEQTNYDTKKSQQPEMNYPLNTIFYGPPGTGKTYTTIKRAAEIVEGRNIEDYDEAKEIFHKHLGEEIEFITFHQNYSYEDFIQGLRPNLEDGNQLSFKRSTGVFKLLADKALKNYTESRKAPKELNEKKAFEEALETLKEQILDSEDQARINKTAYFIGVEDDAFRYSADNWTLGGKGFNGFRMKYSDLIQFFESNVRERSDIKDLNDVSGLAKQHASYFFKTYEIIRGLMPDAHTVSASVQKKNYVLVIDEINRANISRVFGELITLIEPDKRYGREFHIPAKLPSGESFSVPENLYIIGTMNTADKSIALLDIALRRRFDFEAMYPRYEIDGETVHDKDVLKKINDRIINLKGHDFQIGHSYFMKNHMSLKQRMNRKVIPLLLEYFMNDEDEVRDIIEHAGLNVVDKSWPLRINGKK